MITLLVFVVDLMQFYLLFCNGTDNLSLCATREGGKSSKKDLYFCWEADFPVPVEVVPETLGQGLDFPDRATSV